MMSPSPRYLFSPNLILSMRDGGYKNAAHALAELIDNSFEANATVVELLCLERDKSAGERITKQLDQIAVLDNGTGMDADTLCMALELGNGTHLDLAGRKGMGRFGVGLTASSISQCTRIDIWTWQDGIESAIHAYLDIDQIVVSGDARIANPDSETIPTLWRLVSETLKSPNNPKSGTLVVWSNLDRCQWKRADALIRGTEKLVGRIYRHFLVDAPDRPARQIRLAKAEVEAVHGRLIGSTRAGRSATPNDPLYLLPNTSCPPPFRDRPMFRPWELSNGTHCYTLPIRYNGEIHSVHLTFSIACDEARAMSPTRMAAGKTEHGKHAAENVGVSLVREGREIDMDQSLVHKSEARERWWGVEVSFPNALDNLFGVSNNKQTARHFTDAARMSDEELAESPRLNPNAPGFRSSNIDPRAYIIELVIYIRDELNKIRRELAKQGSAAINDSPFSPAPKIREAIDSLPDDLEPDSPAANMAPPNHYETEEYENEEEADNITPTVNVSAAPFAAAFVAAEPAFPRSERETVFSHEPLSSSNFFLVKTSQQSINIILNTNHPAHAKLLHLLDMDFEDRSGGELKMLAQDAANALRELLRAWAVNEEQQPSEAYRNAVRKFREDWGRVARDFLTEDEN